MINSKFSVREDIPCLTSKQPQKLRSHPFPGNKPRSHVAMSIAPEYRPETITTNTMMDEHNGGTLFNEQRPDSDYRMKTVDDVEVGPACTYNKRSKSFAIGLGSNKGFMGPHDGFPPRRIMSLPMGIRPECFDFKDDKLAK